jgi:hypothetical protein
MRTFSAGFQSKLDSTTFTPVVFVDYELKEYVSGSEPDTGTSVTTLYRWSEREITYDSNTYDGTLIASTPLTQTLDDSKQVFGEMSLQVANNIEQLVSVIQAGMKCTVYLGFEDSIGSGAVTDAEEMFIGTVEGAIEYTEDSVSFNLQDIAYSYDRQIPNLITDSNYPAAGREDVGMPLPIINGRVKDHVCRSVTGHFTTFLAQNISPTWSYTWVMYQDHLNGKFNQTTDQLLSSTAGGNWFAYEYDTTIGLNATCETAGTGLVVTPVLNSTIDRVFRTNTLTWDLSWKPLHYQEIIVNVSDWSAGYFKVDGSFVNHDNPTDAFGYTDFEGTKVRYALESSYHHSFTLKTNDAPIHSLDIIVSPDFDGTVELYRIAEWNQDSTEDFIYVADDISHWYRGNVTTNQTTNATEVDLPIVIEHTVNDDDETYFDGYDKGSRIKASFNVKSIEHITSGKSVVVNILSGYNTTLIHSLNTIEGNSGWADDFIIGDYIALDNGKMADMDNQPTMGSDEGGIGTITDAEITNSLAKITDITGDIITVDAYLLADSPTISENTYMVDFACGFECTITSAFDDFGMLGYSAGMSIQVADTDDNDGIYTITNVSGGVITVSEMLTTESVPASLTGWTGLTTINEPVTYTVATYPLNLWKLQLTTPILHGFDVSDIVKLENDADEVFVIADHAVERISNVKINGVPFYNTETSESLAYLLSSTSYSKDGKTRAYLTIPAEEITNVVSKALQIDESNKKVLDDSGVNDDIVIVDDGHSHTSGGSATYSHQLDVHFDAGWFSEYASPYIQVLSGSFYQTIWSSSITLNNPISFTSSSPDVIISFTKTGSGSVNWRYATCSFMRSDNATGDLIYDYQSRGSISYNFNLSSNFPPPTDASVVGTSIAEVVKSGTALSRGDNADTGNLYFSTPISITQARSNLRITCDVIGQVDGSTGLKMPHQQIKALINKYAQNPVIGSEGSADIVEFVNEAEMDSAFSKVYNTLDNTDTASGVYPTMRELVTNTGAYNPSPNADLGNSILSSSTETVNDVAPILYNEKSIHCLDFALNNSNQLREVVGEMLLQSNMIINWRNGVAYIKYLGDSPSVDDTYTNADIMMKSMSLSRSPISELATDITINFDTGNGGFSRNYHYVKQSWNNGVLSETQLDATRKYGAYTRDKYFDLPMIREHAGAEIMAKRFYNEYSDAKFHVGFTTALNNLSVEAGDNITVPIPIHRDSMMDKGLVTKKVIQFGSAISKQADLINLEIRENHTTNGYYLNLVL